MRLSERGCDIKEKGETLRKIKLMKREGDRELLTHLVLNQMLHAHMRKKNGGKREIEMRKKRNVKDEAHVPET